MAESKQTLIDSAPPEMNPPTVYLTLRAGDMDQLSKLKLGQQIRVVLRGTVKEITERESPGAGKEGNLVLENHRITVVPSNEQIEDLMDDED